MLISRPLTNILQKDVPFGFDDDCVEEFEILKKALISAPIIERTSAPWVILVINVNISLVGLIFSSNIFQISSTLEWHGQEDVEPLLDAKDRRLAKAQDSSFLF